MIWNSTRSLDQIVSDMAGQITLSNDLLRLYTFDRSNDEVIDFTSNSANISLLEEGVLFDSETQIPRINFENSVMAIIEDTWTQAEGWKKVAISGFVDPIIIANPVSYNGSDAVVTRHNNIGANSFDIRLQEEGAGGAHGNAETIHYIAHWTRGGTIGETGFQSGRLSGVTDNNTLINFGGSFSNPALFAQIRTFAETDTSALRTTSLTNSNATIFIEEETSNKSSTAHDTGDDVDWLILEQN